MMKMPIITLLFLFCNITRAQISIDIAVEPNLSWLRAADEENIGYGSGIGYSLKIPVCYRISKFVEIETRPGLSHYANRYEAYSHHEKFRFLYLSAPLYFKLLPVNEASFYLGPNIEYQILARENNLGGPSIDKLFNNKLNLGVSGGFSYQFLNGLSFFMFYNYGLSNLISDNAAIDDIDMPDYDGKTTRRSFSIGLSYQIKPLQRK